MARSPKEGPRPFWRNDRDETTRVSTEAASGRQPVAPPGSPVVGLGPGRPAPASVPRGNPDALRAEIDSGRTRDKVDHPDPAAAPLGTDAEAGGAPPSPEEVRLARAYEHGSPEPGGRPDRRAMWVLILGAVAIGLAALAFGSL
jgi:hypothetical protein